MDEKENVIISVFKTDKAEERVKQFSILFAEAINEMEESRKMEIVVLG